MPFDPICLCCEFMNNLYDLNRLGACLLKAFPGLGVITPLRELGNGFSSVAIETVEGLVFRIGKNDLAAQGLDRTSFEDVDVRGVLYRIF